MQYVSTVNASLVISAHDVRSSSMSRLRVPSILSFTSSPRDSTIEVVASVFSSSFYDDRIPWRPLDCNIACNSSFLTSIVLCQLVGVLTSSKQSSWKASAPSSHSASDMSHHATPASTNRCNPTQHNAHSIHTCFDKQTHPTTCIQRYLQPI